MHIYSRKRAATVLERRILGLPESPSAPVAPDLWEKVRPPEKLAICYRSPASGSDDVLGVTGAADADQRWK